MKEIRMKEGKQQTLRIAGVYEGQGRLTEEVLRTARLF